MSIFDDGKSIVFQGFNQSYSLVTNNCLQRSMIALSYGTLSNGENVGDYFLKNGIFYGIIPNISRNSFANIFGNESFQYFNNFGGAK